MITAASKASLNIIRRAAIEKYSDMVAVPLTKWFRPVQQAKTR
jgi:hypothetical protein